MKLSEMKILKSLFVKISHSYMFTFDLLPCCAISYRQWIAGGDRGHKGNLFVDDQNIKP